MMSCHKGIIFTVSFCEHSHTFVKNAELLMVNEGRASLLKWHNFRRACQIHALTLQRGFIT